MHDEPATREQQKRDRVSTMNTAGPMPYKAGRRRSAASHQAILKATLELFADVGLAGLSIEGIAERAGVGKTTIYRRWSAKEDILSDALYLLRGGNPLPDTGSIRDDLLYLARASQELYAREPFMAKLFTKMMAELKTNPRVSLVLGSLFVESIDPDAQRIYAPEIAVDVLLRGIAADPEALASTPGK
jgi:AcrR family transcriptional regulator